VVITPKMPPAGLVRVVERARHILGRVHQRSAPPAAAMIDMIIGAWRAQGIAAAAELKVADALADGPLPIDELARRVEADPDALARLLRALISEGIFVQRRDGRYALNALGKTLRSNAPLSMAGMARMVGLPEHREHWSALVDAVRTGEAVPPKLRGMSGWEYLAQKPEIAAVVNDAMTSMSEIAVDPVVAAYDFAPFQTIVDVGGGHGRGCSRRSSRRPPARVACSTTCLESSKAHPIYFSDTRWRTECESRAVRSWTRYPKAATSMCSRTSSTIGRTRMP
jgi:hypothetical protein